MIDFKFHHEKNKEVLEAIKRVKYQDRDPFLPSERSSWYLIIYYQNIPIGVGSFIESDPETWEITSFYVHEKLRGQKIGSYILKFIQTKIRDLGGRWCIVFMPLAQKNFLLKNGYHESNNGEIIEKNGDMYLKMAKFLPGKTYRPRTRY